MKEIIYHEDGTKTEVDHPETEQLPNNPNNPHFGKKPKTPKDFWGLVLQVYVARANGDNAQALDRIDRLMSSRRAAPIVKIIDSVDLIDPDDRNGDFLRCFSILTTTDHEDLTSGKLMTSQEATSIMTAWPP